MLYTIKNVKNENSNKIGDLIFQTHVVNFEGNKKDLQENDICNLAVYFKEKDKKLVEQIVSIGVTKGEIEAFLEEKIYTLNEFNNFIKIGDYELDIVMIGEMFNNDSCNYASGLATNYRFKLMSPGNISFNTIVREDLKAYDRFGFNLGVKFAFEKPLFTDEITLLNIIEEDEKMTTDYMKGEILSIEEVVERYCNK